MKARALFLAVVFTIALPGCSFFDREPQGKPDGRLAMFVGMDISGSFVKGKYFEDSLDFLAHYLHSHLNGFGDLEVPVALFVGSIGGEKPEEPKTLFPIQTFQNQSVAGIRAKLAEIFPKNKVNPFTDFNAFFRQVATTVKNKKLILKPISIVMITDGRPDIPGKKGDAKFRALDLKPLELLSRNVTVRVLYTDATTGMAWQTKVPRRRVKVWTQDAVVMESWKEPAIMQKGREIASQDRFFKWLADNVDFPVRAQRVE